MSKKMAPAYKLTYFDFTGPAEPIRILFKYGNIEFEDIRIQRADWPALKPKTPFGQLPLLEHNGKVVNQSVAIARYVAKQVKLVGKDDWEDLEIDAVVDTIVDLRTKLMQYNFEQDPVKKENLKEQLFKETVPYFLERLDAQAKKNNGFLVGGRLTWADIYFATVFEVTTLLLKEDLLAKYENLKKLSQTVFETPAIKKWVEERPKAKKF